MMEFSCPNCGHKESKMFEICPSCEIVVAKFHRPSVPRHYRPDYHGPVSGKSGYSSHRWMAGKRQRVAGIALIAGFILFVVFGSFHFIHGSTYNGKPIVQKMSFGFAETFINTDRIFGLPRITVQQRHPLAYKVLQREGYIVSEFEAERRIRERLLREHERTRQDYDRDLQELRRSLDNLFK